MYVCMYFYKYIERERERERERHLMYLMYVYTFIYIYIICICTYTHTHTHTHTHIYIHTYIYIYIYIYMIHTQGLCPTMYVKPYELASLLPKHDQPKPKGGPPSQSVSSAPRTVTRSVTPSQRQSVTPSVMNHEPRTFVTKCPTNKTPQAVSHSVTINSNNVESSSATAAVAANRAVAESSAPACHLESSQEKWESMERGGGEGGEGGGGGDYFNSREEDSGKCGLGCWFR